MNSRANLNNLEEKAEITAILVDGKINSNCFCSNLSQTKSSGPNRTVFSSFVGGTEAGKLNLGYKKILNF